MTEADRTYMHLMIFKIISSTKERVSVKQIHKAIEPNMGMSIRSLQRYLNGLTTWGLLAKDVETPQGFTLTENAKLLFMDLAKGIEH